MARSTSIPPDLGVPPLLSYQKEIELRKRFNLSGDVIDLVYMGPLPLDHPEVTATHQRILSRMRRQLHIDLLDLLAKENVPGPPDPQMSPTSESEGNFRHQAGPSPIQGSSNEVNRRKRGRSPSSPEDESRALVRRTRREDPKVTEDLNDKCMTALEANAKLAAKLKTNKQITQIEKNAQAETHEIHETHKKNLQNLQLRSDVQTPELDEPSERNMDDPDIQHRNEMTHTGAQTLESVWQQRTRNAGYQHAVEVEQARLKAAHRSIEQQGHRSLAFHQAVMQGQAGMSQDEYTPHNVRYAPQRKSTYHDRRTRRTMTPGQDSECSDSEDKMMVDIMDTGGEHTALPRPNTIFDR